MDTKTPMRLCVVAWLLNGWYGGNDTDSLAVSDDLESSQANGKTAAASCELGPNRVHR